MMLDLKANPFYLDDEGIQWVKSTQEAMSLEQKVGQLFCLNLRDGNKEFLDEIYSVMQPGGCMFRAMPLESAIGLVNELRNRSEIPLLISANLEKGGSGIVLEGTTYASEMEVAATNKVENARRLGEICGTEAAAVGANWTFSPIIDIDTNFRNPITNTRTFGSDPETVKAMGVAYVEEIQKHGIAATIKHFPGDGRDERDQHLLTSVNDCTCEEWDATYGAAYKACIDAGAKAVMAAQIMLPAYSKKLRPDIKEKDILPASQSKELLNDLLRDELGFNGLIVTDDSVMVGFMATMPRKISVPLSIENGVDMFLFVKNLKEDYTYMLEGVKSGILSQKRLEDAVTRILALKAAQGLHKSLNSNQQSLEEAKKVVGCEKFALWAKECADASITLVKEEKGVLPLSVDKYKRILFCALEEEGGAGQYAVKSVCKDVIAKLETEGFEVTRFTAENGEGEHSPTCASIMDHFDLIIYCANIATKSNQTTVRIEWAQPRGANCPRFITSVPTIFISLENPYHLLDVPRIRTFINTYSSNPHIVDALIEKLMGRSSFKGTSPVDAFCGKWDTRLS